MFGKYIRNDLECWESGTGFGAPNRFIGVVKYQISIVLHDQFIASIARLVSFGAPNSFVIRINDYISVLLVDESWIFAVVSVCFWLPYRISFHKMSWGIDDKVAIGLKYSVISIGRLDVLVDSKNFTTLKVCFSLFAYSHAQNTNQDQKFRHSFYLSAHIFSIYYVYIKEVSPFIPA